MSFTNLLTNETYALEADEEVILGRHKFGLESQYISARSVKVVYKENRRCYATKLSDKLVRLNRAAMPKDQEMQLKNGDKLVFKLDGLKGGKTVELEFNLPELGDELNRTVAILKRSEEDANKQVEEPIDDAYLTDQSHEEYISDRSAEFDEAISLSDLSDESDLLGGMDYFSS